MFPNTAFWALDSPVSCVRYWVLLLYFLDNENEITFFFFFFFFFFNLKDYCIFLCLVRKKKSTLNSYMVARRVLTKESSTNVIIHKQTLTLMSYSCLFRGEPVGSRITCKEFALVWWPVDSSMRLYGKRKMLSWLKTASQMLPNAMDSVWPSIIEHTIRCQCPSMPILQNRDQCFVWCSFHHGQLRRNNVNAGLEIF